MREQAKFSTDWSRVDAYENTPADYEELPELDDAFFERAERGRAIGGRPDLPMVNPQANRATDD